MSTKLFVGNLSQIAKEADLENLFNGVGLVLSVSIPSDAKTKAHKGFGFVNMTEAGAQTAIQTLNGSMLYDRQISVREAGPKE